MRTLLTQDYETSCCVLTWRKKREEASSAYGGVSYKASTQIVGTFLTVIASNGLISQHLLGVGLLCNHRIKYKSVSLQCVFPQLRAENLAYLALSEVAQRNNVQPGLQERCRFLGFGNQRVLGLWYQVEALGVCDLDMNLIFVGRGHGKVFGGQSYMVTE